MQTIRLHPFDKMELIGYQCVTCRYGSWRLRDLEFARAIGRRDDVKGVRQDLLHSNSGLSKLGDGKIDIASNKLQT